MQRGTGEGRSDLWRIIKSATIWDNHGCLPLRLDEAFLPQLERYRCAGVHVASINVGYGDMSWMEHALILSSMRRWIAQRPTEYRLVSTVEDVYRCKTDGRLGLVFDVEGMCPVQENICLVQMFYELGVRWMLIAYNRSNGAGGGCMDSDTGLTALGRSIIDEMERVGMVLCLSHANSRTVDEAIEYGRNPAIFSHSNPYGVTPSVRNISDRQMIACARKGGVIGLSGIGIYLGNNEDVVKHLLTQLHYVIDLVGAEHVGLGLDYVFDRTELDEHVRRNPNLYPPGLTGGVGMVEPEDILSIADGLARSNLSDTQICGVLGGNWLRIATKVWH